MSLPTTAPYHKPFAVIIQDRIHGPPDGPEMMQLRLLNGGIRPDPEQPIQHISEGYQ
jgi:hypothetical protein